MVWVDSSEEDTWLPARDLYNCEALDKWHGRSSELPVF